MSETERTRKAAERTIELAGEISGANENKVRNIVVQQEKILGWHPVGGEPEQPPVDGEDAIDAGSLTWLHADVSQWPVTAETTHVSVSPAEICIEHTKAGQWPVNAEGLEGNPWICACVGGVWYAATYEWLRSGQLCKALGVSGNSPDDTAHALGPHIKQTPLDSWVPVLGEQVYLFVSTFARDSQRTVNERSNIVAITWPY